MLTEGRANRHGKLGIKARVVKEYERRAFDTGGHHLMHRRPGWYEQREGALLTQTRHRMSSVNVSTGYKKMPLFLLHFVVNDDARLLLLSFKCVEVMLAISASHRH